MSFTWIGNEDNPFVTSRQFKNILKEVGTSKSAVKRFLVNIQ